jgi:hypothetical protein
MVPHFQCLCRRVCRPKTVRFSFDVRGSKILCDFESDTNKANQGRNISIPCSSILDGPSIILLTSQSVCSFTSGSSLLILLPKYNLLLSFPPFQACPIKFHVCRSQSVPLFDDFFCFVYFKQLNERSSWMLRRIGGPCKN